MRVLGAITDASKGRTGRRIALGTGAVLVLCGSPVPQASGDLEGPQCIALSVPVDRRAESMLDGPLVILPVFNMNVTAGQQAVIQQAIQDWEDVVEDAGQIANPYTITFMNGPLPPGILARANTIYDAGSGVILSCTITIDNDGSSTFFVDPTPALDEEFTGPPCTPSQPCSNSDLLSVMRHEIGHALGWTGAFTMFPSSPNPLVSGLISGTTFDPGRLNIAMDPMMTAHSSAVDHPNDLMNPGLPQGVRRAISLYPTASLPARAIDHDIPMKFVDPSAAIPGTGSADLPWQTLGLAVTASPPGAPLLLIPGTYDEPAPLTITSTHSFDVARGGSALVR